MCFALCLTCFAISVALTRGDGVAQFEVAGSSFLSKVQTPRLECLKPILRHVGNAVKQELNLKHCLSKRNA